jgi:hypothetical protein
MTSLAIQHRDTIIARMRRGDRLADIARDLGFSSHASISMRLKDDPDYQDAKLDSLAQRMDDREAELEAAQDNVTIARARELLSHARWRAEREGAAIWGQQRSSDAGNSVNVTVVVDALAQARQALETKPAIDITPTTSSGDLTPDQGE